MLTQKMIYRLQIKKKENHCYSNSLSKLGIGEDDEFFEILMTVKKLYKEVLAAT